MSEIFPLQRKTLNTQLVNINKYIESTKDDLCQVCLKVLLKNLLSSPFGKRSGPSFELIWIHFTKRITFLCHFVWTMSMTHYLSADVPERRTDRQKMFLFIPLTIKIVSFKMKTTTNLQLLFLVRERIIETIFLVIRPHNVVAGIFTVDFISFLFLDLQLYICLPNWNCGCGCEHCLEIGNKENPRIERAIKNSGRTYQFTAKAIHSIWLDANGRQTKDSLKAAWSYPSYSD